jgi:methylmalonyl-CoA mutase
VQPKKKNSEIKDLDLRADFPSNTYEEWRKAVEALLKGAHFEKVLITQTYEGIELKPLYRKEDAAGIPYLHTLPGFEPYLRGIQYAGFLSAPWQIAQQIPYSSPQKFNKTLRYDLERGQTSVYMPLDAVTIAGLDSDHGNVGEVGRGGVTISTLEDLDTALQGVNLDTTPVFIKAGSAGILVAAFLGALCRKQDKNVYILKGCVETDPLGELMITGKLPAALDQLYDEMTILAIWASECALNLQVIAVHGDYFHNAGASAVQELAFAVTTGVEYVREVLSRDVIIDDIAPNIRFTFSLGSNFFMEIAKLRAARLLWSKVVEAFGGSKESRKMHIHAQTSLWNKTVYDPYVNMLRATTEAFSGIVGGVNSMHVGAFDETIGLPDEFSRRVARNTQIILKEECHLDRVIDPAGGSWYVESLTSEIAGQAWELFQEVERRGGMYKALEAGFPRDQIAETAQQRIMSLARRKDRMVGTNIYPNVSEKPIESRQPDYKSIFEDRKRYLENFRTSGDLSKHILPLEKLQGIIKSKTGRLMEALIAAAFSSATISEICTTLRPETVGKPHIKPLQLQRGAEMFERLRKAMQAYRTQNGSVPKVFLANMGPVSQHKARADFAAGFFQVGGFEVIDNRGFSTPGEAAKAAIDSGAQIVVICSADETYRHLVEPVTSAVKKSNQAITLVLAGYPEDQVDVHKKAGVDEFIHIRANVYEVLEKLMKKSGVIS